MADNLDTIEQRDAIKFMQKVGEELSLVRQAQSRCAEITMLAWTTLSAASKHGLTKRPLLSSRKASWTLCHACKSALLLMETM